MRVVYMGTPALSASILRAIASEHDVVGVYTRPDAVRGRGKKLVPSDVKVTAMEESIPVFTPASLRDAQVQDELRELQPDVICVAAYGAMRSFLSETPAEMVSSRMVIQALASSFILLPVLTVFLDSLAKSLGLRRYTSSIHFFFSDDDENDWQEPDE